VTDHSGIVTAGFGQGSESFTFSRNRRSRSSEISGHVDPKYPLKQAKVRYRPPKECRDTSVTLALQAGADPVWVAKQHGHSLTVMMKDYAKWIPGADRGRNLAAINRALDANSAPNPQQHTTGKEKAL
jgi:hypothetical protein